MTKGIFPFCLLFISLHLTAQSKISFDFSNVKNTKLVLSGINFSSFYHFNEHLSGGIEVNRFFGKQIIKKDIAEENHPQEIEISAWDFDLNFHYNIHLLNHCATYPIMGLSQTTDKEKLVALGKEHIEHFWSFNTGFGVNYDLGRISPHVEYLFTWGKINQEFLLIGLSYEFGFKKLQTNDLHQN